jgi:PTS system mannose-specific IIA component
MIGMVLVTHGRLAEEFLRALEHIVGPQEKVGTVCIGPDDDMEERRKMFGGTPSNLAISVLDEGEVEVVAGVNLPMLIKLASLRGERSLKKAVHEAQEAGRKYISVASQLLAEQAS